MGEDIFETAVNLIKLTALFFVMISLVPLLVWAERRVSALIQNRLGPNRIGPLGLTQTLADAIKQLAKENFAGAKVYKSLFYLAPIMALLPPALVFGSIPFSSPVHIETFEIFGRVFGPYKFYFQAFYMNIGIVFALGISSLSAYALLVAGWSSGNKYSLYGALRAAAQTISYELALSLSLVGLLMLFGSFDFLEIVKAQSRPLSFSFLDRSFSISWLPNWGIFYQPLGALILFIALIAESNRIPFDLPEAEAELVAGYHTEYGGVKLILFYMGEYAHIMVASALMVVFYFGGSSFYPFFTEKSLLHFFPPPPLPAYISLLFCLLYFWQSFFCFYLRFCGSGGLCPVFVMIN